MRYALQFLFGSTILLLPLSGDAIVSSTDLSWLYGYWYVTADEDHTVADWNEFRADGTYVNISPDCHRASAKFHIYDSDIYVTFEIPNKGPIALIFRPGRSFSELTYTSPRTRNNATLTKVTKLTCPAS